MLWAYIVSTTRTIAQLALSVCSVRKEKAAQVYLAYHGPQQLYKRGKARSLRHLQIVGLKVPSATYLPTLDMCVLFLHYDVTLFLTNHNNNYYHGLRHSTQ